MNHKVIPEDEIDTVDSIWNTCKKIVFCLCTIMATVLCITSCV